MTIQQLDRFVGRRVLYLHHPEMEPEWILVDKDEEGTFFALDPETHDVKYVLNPEDMLRVEDPLLVAPEVDGVMLAVAW
jgi:hypothetical protein